MLKIFVGFCLLVATLIFSFLGSTPRACQQPFIFFDLGDTLIDTTTHNYDPMFVMPGALEYLKALHDKRFPLGLISDVPESWGRDKPELNLIKDYQTAKLRRLLNFIDAIYPEDHSSWIGPRFEWSYFQGRVVLPFKTADRKKNGGRIMYQRARLLAAQQNCPAIYETSEKKEIEPARDAGLIPFLNGSDKTSFYLTIEKIDKLIKDSQI